MTKMREKPISRSAARSLWLSALLVTGFLTSSPPESRAEREKITVGFVAQTLGFFDAAQEAAQAKADELGITLDPVRADGEDGQLAALMASDNFDALVIRPFTGLRCQPVIDAIRGSTPIVQFDSLQFEAASCRTLVASVTTDNFALGTSGGGALASLLGPEGEAVILSLPHEWGIESVNSRADGASAALSAAGVELTTYAFPNEAWFTHDADVYEASCCEFRQRVQDIRAAFLEGAGAFTTFEGANEAVLQCVLADCEVDTACASGCAVGSIPPEAVNLPGWVGVDRSPHIEQAVCSGDMDMFMEQDPSEMGALAVKEAYEAVTKGRVWHASASLPTTTFVASVQITAADLTCTP